MELVKPYIRILVLFGLVLALMALAHAGGRCVSPAVAAPGGLPDQGLLAVQTNEKLDQVNANLKEVSAKLQAILELLRSGKVQVVATEGPAKAGGGSTGRR